MTIVVTKKLTCDFPECGQVKSDLVWWESSVGEGPWRHTKDDRDWCPNHTEESIQELYTSGILTDPCGCMECDPPERALFRRMYVCQKCGSKRCPGAMNHTYACIEGQ